MIAEQKENADGDAENPTVAKVILGLFDVLGFSGRVEKQGVEKLLSVYRELIEKAVLEPARRCVGTAQFPQGRVLTLFELPVRYAYFSDTILLWVPLHQAYPAAFVRRCADLMCEALSMGMPLRGAICLGDAVMHQDTNTYIGKPLVEAAGLEKGQDWIGLTLGWSATWPLFMAELEGSDIIEYEAPMKQHCTEVVSPIVVDWPRAWREKYGTSPKEQLTFLNADPKFTRYYDHAIAFADYSVAHHDWWQRPKEIPANAKLRLVPLAKIRESDAGDA